MTKDETVRRMSCAASVVKLVCGVGNNAAWLVVLDALDQAKRCQRYKGAVKMAFRRCVEIYRAQERQLIYGQENRMFHMGDMSPEIRKKYGDITDRQYFEFWTGLGASAYEKTRPLLTSLWNKYRLSLERHGVKDSEKVAWVMVAMASLELAVKMYGQAVDECVTGYELPKSIVERVFGQFSMGALRGQWKKAMEALAPDTEGYDLDEVEERNIDMGLRQLLEAWCDPGILYDSTFAAVEEYDEVFRTKGEQKKAMREIAEVREETGRIMNTHPSPPKGRG